MFPQCEQFAPLPSRGAGLVFLSNESVFDSECGSAGSGYGQFHIPGQNISLTFTGTSNLRMSASALLATNLRSHCGNVETWSGTQVSVVFYPWTDSGAVVMSLDGATIDTVETPGSGQTCSESTWTSNTFPSAAHVFTITANSTLYIYRIAYVVRSYVTIDLKRTKLQIHTRNSYGRYAPSPVLDILFPFSQPKQW